MRAAAEGALHGGGLPAYAFTRRRGSILGANGTGSKRGAGTNLHEAYAWLYDEQRPPPMAERPLHAVALRSAGVLVSGVDESGPHPHYKREGGESNLTVA